MKKNLLFLKILLLAGLYFATGFLGLKLQPVAGFATLVWPPSGIALAGLVLFGRRLWPGAALGALLLNVAVGAPWPVACGIMVGNTLEALAGFWGLRRFQFNPNLERLPDILHLIIYAALLSPLVAATIGVSSLVLGGILPASSFFLGWRTWWLGDTLGILTVAPLLLAWASKPVPRFPRPRFLEASALMGFLLLVSLLTFGRYPAVGFQHYLVSYLFFVPAIWAALRFGARGTVLVITFIVVIALGGTYHSLGPFVRDTLYESLLFAQVFIGILTASALILAAVVSERLQEKRRLSLQYKMARILAESRGLQEAMPRILQTIVEALDWALGAVWLLDPGQKKMVCFALWSNPAWKGQAEEFEEETKTRAFEKGMGLPGRVWQAKIPIWIGKVTDDDWLPRIAAARASGLRAAFAFPIVVDEDILGVIEFFTSTPVRPDERTLETFTALGSLIGQFITKSQAEAWVKRSEAQQKAIFESSLDAIIMMDHEGKVVEFNPAAEKIFGYRRGETLGRNMVDLIIPPALREKHRQRLRHYMGTGQDPVLGRRIEISGQRADGSLVPVELAITRLPIEGPPLFTGFLRDMSERRKSEERLTESESRFRATFEQAAVGIAHVGSDGRWLRFNQKLCEILGYDPEELRQKTFQSITYPEDLDADLAQAERLLAGEIDTYSMEKRYIHKNGTVFWANITVSALRNEKGEFQHFISVVEDITKRKDYESQMEQVNEQLKSLDKIRSEFVSMVSHELRTPLSAIKEGIEIVYDEIEGSLNDAQKGTLGISRKNIDRLARLVNNVLQFSKVEAGKMELNLKPTNLSELVQDTAALMQIAVRKKGIAFESAIPEHTVTLSCDADKIQQVLINLIDNAIKYTPPAGRIFLKLSANDLSARLEVEDSGVGISPEDQEKIFKMFEQGGMTRKMGITGGVGVGLAVCKQLVEQHRGQITVHSEPGRGARFVVILPR